MTEPTPEKPPRRSLMQKYDIPISHLDFDYIRACTDARYCERIYVILKSGQEGHYPDLEQCAQDRLRQLNPSSRALRVEIPLLDAAALPDREWQALNGELIAHVDAMHRTDQQLRSSEREFSAELPAIRSALATAAVPPKPQTVAEQAKSLARIRSCDYAQWDRYDADTELTRIDLAEEQARESSEIRDRQSSRPIDTIVREADTRLRTGIDLSSIERDRSADMFRVLGNEHFRAGDFEDSIAEYTRSIAVRRTSVALANRAMAYLKLGENHKAIDDCDESIGLDGGNVKAHLRKAQALQNEDRYREAFGVYADALRIDATNAVALGEMRKLRERLPDVPPPNAHRMRISEADDEKKPVAKKASECADTGEDFARLIMPKRIVPSKLQQMATSMKGAVGKPRSTAPDGQQPKAAPAAIRTRRTTECPEIRLEMPTKNANRTEYKNGIVIEEL